MRGNAVEQDEEDTGDAQRLFNAEDVPLLLRRIPDWGYARTNATTGRRVVVWGWREWLRVHPRLAKHVKAHGRIRLAGVLWAAQAALLPKKMHRTELAITQAASARTQIDVLEVVAFLNRMTRASKEAKQPPPGKVIKAQPALRVVGREAPSSTTLPPIMGNLTDEACHAATPHPDARRHRRIADGQNMYLEISKGGTKRWFWKYKFEGVERRISLGVFPQVNCARARELAHIARHDKNAGRDPVRARLQREHDALTGAPPPKPRGRPPKVPRATFAAPVAHQPPADIPAPAPVPAAPPARTQAAADADLAHLLQTPIAVFLPAFREFMAQQLREFMQPMRDEHERALRAIAKEVRRAVIDVVGPPAVEAPQPPAAAANTDPAPPAPQALQASIAPDEGKASPPTPAPVSAPAAGPAAPVVVGHSMEDLAHVAQAMGIPAAKREAVLIVGVHPKVEQEVERSFGRTYRFYFKRPDAFNSSNDIPASVDAVLIARKPHMPSEIISFFRRTNMPNRKITNDATSVMWALREIFSDDQQPRVH